MNFSIITLFPESIKTYLNSSVLGRAIKRKVIRVNLIDLRKFGVGKHKKVDDRPFGGGFGMVIKIEPILKAVCFALGMNKKKIKINDKIDFKKNKPKNTRIILFSTRGKIFDQNKAKSLLKYENLILICGHYEGVDERVARYIADEEISIGKFVLSGGELPALVVLEAVSRFVPGFLGKYESLEDIKGYYPVYTRPAIFNGWKVPPVLLSGNHQKIKEWRNNKGNKNKKSEKRSV
jgi:tRNA (guanine37-N1)-methyltransferase